MDQQFLRHFYISGGAGRSMWQKAVLSRGNGFPAIQAISPSVRRQGKIES
jgi:hypothetical protein